MSTEKRIPEQRGDVVSAISKYLAVNPEADDLDVAAFLKREGIQTSPDLIQQTRRRLERREDERYIDELRREHKLVRSSGRISKRTMAIAFGLVFVLIGVSVGLGAKAWLLAIVLGAIGAIATFWGVYASVRKKRLGIREKEGTPFAN